MAEEYAEEEDLLAYWYMCGVDGYDLRYVQANRLRYERELEWEEQKKRLRESKLPMEEMLLIDMIKQEKEYGVLWECSKCTAEYRVKTPFHRLYCSECLGSLRCRRLIPKGRSRPGYWIFEDVRHG